jgi:hypothetical protein
VKRVIHEETWIGAEIIGVSMSENTSKWKSVDEDSGTERMRVPAGWLYRTLDITSGQTTALAFVPDPEPRRRVVIKRR